MAKAKEAWELWENNSGGQVTRPLGLILYEGPSLFDPDYSIAVIATNLPGRESKNSKTGKMVQIWIIPTDGGILPALANGTDASVCGDCPLRPITARARRRAEKLLARREDRKPKPVPICYVNQGRAPAGVSRAYFAGSYTPTSPELESRYLSGQRLRFGAWGDPAAAPSSLWTRLAALPGVRWTGYTHGHLRQDVSDLRALVMLSADSAEIAMAYRARGWRTFRVRHGAADPLLPGEIACPASAEAGARIQCDRCLLCDGAARMDIRRLPSIAIIDHGPGASRAKGKEN